MKKALQFFLISLLLWSCQTEKKSQPEFVHDISEGPTPWTSSAFELEEDYFTFAIIADLAGGERPGVYSTAVRQLNRLDPTFVLSVGDLIEGGSHDSTILNQEWDSFEARTAQLNMPFFHLGGNHDLTNLVMRDFWADRFGPRYYYFKYENVLFLMLDSEDFEDDRMMEIDAARAEAMKVIRGEVEGEFEDTAYAQMIESEAGGMRQEQIDYFKEVLIANSDVRWTFVLMHKPLWKREGNKGLGQLEELLATRPYTVINGHLHTMSHRIRNERDYIMLGTTGGYQPKDSMAFDHVTLVRMDSVPVITHLKMEGILDETGKVPD
ncbi:metallophosphoesterase family protein [Reichenbachiella ulvae]|uniref:Metallophosphoesterase n=1 Tax=Reichenbachiella ulvae TaxID=2980104 RepID=A0ABT3CRH7_9BACT|nr:metallophosphoesterase [Reichenbachiella ulvae]MCV9386134.1 metallophosphoesterase [Reichenbachiella ulvae]